MHAKRAPIGSLVRLLTCGLLTAGACGGGNPLPTTHEPRIIPGGGIGDGPIRGALNVFVIDEDTRHVLSSAVVRVGAAEEAEPCQALTDSTGLARFGSSGSGAAASADGGAGAAGCTLLTKPVM